jgi:protein gp37
MENSHIEWTDHTWNPWIGCTKVDKLCTNCYAEARDIRFEDGKHWGKGAPRQRTAPGNWREPYRWNRAHTDALRAWCDGAGVMDQKPRSPRVFCASLADWLDGEVPIEWLADMMVVIAECRNLTWLLLTKRPENWRPRMTAACELLGRRGEAGDYAASAAFIMVDGWLSGHAGPPEHIWMGTSVGDQESADTRIPQLLTIPAKIRFLSCEPLLGPVNLLRHCNLQAGAHQQFRHVKCVDWVIAGGESGKNARPMHPDWATSLRDQCKRVDTAFFFKQWGEWAPGTHVESDGTLATATLFDEKWIFGTQTAKQSENCHADDSPDMYRVGKRNAKPSLDGKEWKEFPA